MLLFKSKNVKQFLAACEKLVTEGASNKAISCHDYLMSAINNGVEKMHKELDKMKIDDFEAAAASYIYNAVFDELSSGKYHVYRGELNTVGIGPSMYDVCIYCLDVALRKGIIDSNQRNEQISILDDNIKCVG